MINCLICNILISVQSKESHIESPEHIKLYTKCQENRKKLKNEKKYLINQIDNKEEKEMAQEKKLLDLDKPATVKDADNNCSGSKELNNNNTSITKQGKENQVMPASEALHEAIQFAKQNHMKYKRNGTYCNACNIKISSSLKMMKEHVSETSHKEKVDQHNRTKLNGKTSGSDNKKSMLDFIDSETGVKNIFCNDKVINDNICIEAVSFDMIGKSGGKLRCHVCEVSFHPSQMEEHKRTYKHSNAMLVTPVLTDFNNEFIREV